MLRDEMELYTKLTGEDATHVPIIKIGAYLDGYEKGTEVLDKIRAEIAEYGSIWVQYQITGKSDRDIEQLVSGVLKQAKEQVLEILDKYRAESESQESEG